MDQRGPKRRLPVVPSAPPPEDAKTAAWLWPPLGGLVVIATWVPLAMIVTLMMGRVVAAHGTEPLVPVVAVMLLGTFAGSCWLGGALVGRFSTQPKRRDATLAGVWGWFFVVLLAALGNALRPVLMGAIVAICLLLVALPLATLGGRSGQRRRPPSSGT